MGGIIYTYDGAAGEAVGKRESHTPKIEAPAEAKSGKAIKVMVNVGLHPSTVEHSIRWVMLLFEGEGRAFNPVVLGKVTFNPGTTDPSVVFSVKLPGSGVLHALEYCNLHGLWSGKKTIKVA